jgi:hypothetical protein
MQVITESCDGATEWIPRPPVGSLQGTDEMLSSDDDNNIPLDVVAGRALHAPADSESDDDRPLIEVANQARRQ